MFKFWKASRILAMGGSVLFLGGCFSGWWSNFWVSSIGTIAWEFLLDNNGIFDLFTDS